MERRRTWLIGGVGGVLLLLGFIAFVLPVILRGEIETRVSRATGRTLTIARLSINPLTWTAAMEGVRLGEKGSQQPFVSFSSARVRVSPTSLWRLAPVLTDITLDAPHLRIVRTGPNRFNFSDLLEPKPGGEKKPPGEPARFSLNNIVVSGGSIDFRDEALPVPKEHAVRQLLIQVPFISNIPYLADRYVAPKLVAVVNGAPLNFEGKMKPFAKGMEASVAIRLQDLDIPFYAAYFPAELPLRLAAGRLTTDLTVTHRLAKGEKPDIAAAGTVNLSGIDLRERSGEPLLTLTRGGLTVVKLGVLSNEYRLARIVLESPVVTLSRDRGGVWNFRRLQKKGADAGAAGADRAKTADKEAGRETRPLVAVGEMQLTGGTVRFSDGVPPGGFTTEARQLGITVAGFSTEQGKSATLEASFTTLRNETLAAAGTLSVTPFSFTVQPKLTGWVVEAAYPYLADTLTAAISGRLNAGAEISYSAEKGFTVGNGTLELRQLAIPFAPKEGVRVPLLTVKGAAYSQKEQSLVVEQVTQQGGEVVLSRDSGGLFSPTRLIRKGQGEGRPSPAKPKPSASGPRFRYQVKQVAVNGLNAAFTDHTREETPTYTLKKATLSLADLRGPRMTPMPFRFNAGYGHKGTVKADGRVCPEPFLFKGSVSLARIPVLDAEPYLPEGVNVVLADGTLDATLGLDLAGRPSGVGGSFRGEVGIRNFYSLDGDENEDLLKWESLQLDGMSGTLAPFSLRLTGVSLNNYYARVIINRQGVINLQELYQPEPATTGDARPAAAAPVTAMPEAAPPASPAAPKSIRIDSVTLQDGVLNFTDRHLNREFSTTMVNLGGRISGLTAEEGKAADVDLRGNLENQSPLRITGRINPLRGDLFLDLLIRFSDIELSPMTPYSGTYLGYTVDKGKLSLDLKYLIEQKRLKAENKVFMDQLTFGTAVESDKATRLPVRLAVALLKDRKGEIRLDLPVAGRTDDPEFSVWGVVWQMLKNLLVKAATSPLSLLQSMFSGGDDFSGIAFAPGTSSLSKAEEAKLGNLAKALLDRPAIKLEVTGFVDQERDAEGYRSELLLKKMRTEKFLALVKEKREAAGQTAESVDILPGEYSPLLKSVYEKEKFPKPRTFIGTLKSLPDAEMKKLILANTVVGEPQLRGLARERAMAVRNFLVAEGKLPQERIFEKGGDIFAPPKQAGMTGSRVEFGVAVQ